MTKLCMSKNTAIVRFGAKDRAVITALIENDSGIGRHLLAWFYNLIMCGLLGGDSQDQYGGFTVFPILRG